LQEIPDVLRAEGEVGPLRRPVCSERGVCGYPQPVVAAAVGCGGGRGSGFLRVGRGGSSGPNGLASGEIFGPGDAELLYPEADGAGFHLEEFGCATRSLDDASGLAKDADDVGALDGFERLSPPWVRGALAWQGRRGHGRGGRR